MLTRRNLSSPCIREGQVLSEGESLDGEDGGPAVLGGFTYLAGESGCASGDESDVSGDSGILNDATAASAALQASKGSSIRLSMLSPGGKTLLGVSSNTPRKYL